jgi:hypothetical protein
MTPLLLGLLLGRSAPLETPEVVPPVETPQQAPRAPPVRVEPTPDGGFLAYRGEDPIPLEGVDLYRALLRLDLVEQHESERSHRRFAFAAAGFSAVAGPALGYVFGKARQAPTDQCVTVPPSPQCEPSQEVLDENERVLRESVIVGSAVGLGVAAGLVWLGLSIHPRVPDLAEARELADRYSARQGYGPAPGPEARLRILPAPGGLRLALDVRFR